MSKITPEQIVENLTLHRDAVADLLAERDHLAQKILTLEERNAELTAELEENCALGTQVDKGIQGEHPNFFVKVTPTSSIRVTRVRTPVDQLTDKEVEEVVDKVMRSARRKRESAIREGYVNYNAVFCLGLDQNTFAMFLRDAKQVGVKRPRFSEGLVVRFRYEDFDVYSCGIMEERASISGLATFSVSA